MLEDLILITGVTGYIGFKTFVLALEAGFKVRAVIRRSEQATKLQAHPRVAPHVSNLEWVIIPDLSDSNSFDVHLHDVTGILHLASPLANESDNYDRDIVKPAIKVTLSILNAAQRNPSIKRVVITSSAVTLVPYSWMFDPSTVPDTTLFTPQHMNSKLNTTYGSSMEAYFASKSLSRIATHEFVASHQPSFEFVNFLPTVVFGPDELSTNAAELMKDGRAVALGLLLGSKIPEMIGATVHVDDVARAHVHALKPSVPGNKEYILSSNAPEGIVWEDAKAVVRREFPGAVEKGVLSLRGEMETRKWRLDTTATEEAFGWKFVSFEETVKELVEQYLRLVENGRS